MLSLVSLLVVVAFLNIF
jgi:hypothetical protein